MAEGVPGDSRGAPLLVGNESLWARCWNCPDLQEKSLQDFPSDPRVEIWHSGKVTQDSPLPLPPNTSQIALNIDVGRVNSLLAEGGKGEEGKQCPVPPTLIFTS